MNFTLQPCGGDYIPITHSAQSKSSFPRCPVSPPEFRGCYTSLLGVGERLRYAGRPLDSAGVVVDTGIQES